MSAPIDATRPGGVLPAALRPTMREVPALAWTAAHALSSLPTGHRGGMLLGACLRPIAALWVIPMWVIVWIPAVGLTTHRGEVARRSRRALVLALAPGGVSPRAAAFMLTYSCLAAVIPFTLLPRAGLILLIPVAADTTAMARRVARAGRGTAGRAAQLAAAGKTVRIVGLYAAYPPRHGHGNALLEQLVRSAPADVWLLAAAGSEKLAELYRTVYGFRSWHPDRPLLLERPPRGS